MKSFNICILSTVALMGFSVLLKAEEISGFDDSQSNWNLSLGEEYPGAKAELDIREDANLSHKGLGFAVVTYDFSQGGAYVGIGKATSSVTEETPVFSFWAKCSSRIRLKIRIVDSADQTFDIERLLDSDEWKKVDIDINTTEGFTVFGGSGDKVFKFPSKAVFIGFTKPTDVTGEVFFDTVVSSKTGDIN